MTAPLAMWEVQYSWAAPGKTYRGHGTRWVLTTSAADAIFVVTDRLSTSVVDPQVHQVIRRTHGDLLIDWDAVDNHRGPWGKGNEGSA
jgi:hypothetical protein